MVIFAELPSLQTVIAEPLGKLVVLSSGIVHVYAVVFVLMTFRPRSARTNVYVAFCVFNGMSRRLPRESETSVELVRPAENVTAPV